MRTPLYDVNARRKTDSTVSVTLNSDLVARASALGINISRAADAAVVRAFEAAEKAKIREAARMVDEYVALHGMPFDDWANEVPDSDDTEHARAVAQRRSVDRRAAG